MAASISASSEAELTQHLAARLGIDADAPSRELGVAVGTEVGHGQPSGTAEAIGAALASPLCH